MSILTITTFLGTIPPGLWALIGTIVGTIGLKVLEKFLNRDSEKRDDRRDFRDEIKDLIERVNHLEDELSEWKDRYYKSQEEILTLKAMIIGAGIKVPDNISDLDK